MKPIKVLMLVPNLRVSNGVTSFVMNYFNDINHQRVQMDFALYSDRETPYYETVKQQGGKIFILPSIKNLSAHIKECNKILAEGHYDIIHDNTLHVSIPMVWCAKRFGISVRILHSHNSKMGETATKELRNKMLLPILRALATDYAACSQLAARAMFGRRDFTVIPNVIQTEKYKFDSAARERIRKNMNVTDKYVVGTVGRLAEQKNPFFAVDVFACLLKKCPNAEYWWAGSGPLQNQVRAYVEEKGLSEHVKLLGSRENVLELYQGMDAFFLPSLFEGLPLTGVEAQAMGLPMVVSDTVTDEMVYTDLVDYVGLDAPVEVWVEHLQKALNRNVERAEYTHELERSEFSNTGCGEKLMEIYRTMLE